MVTSNIDQILIKHKEWKNIKTVIKITSTRMNKKTLQVTEDTGQIPQLLKTINR